MFKLYGNNKGMKLLDMSEDENDIIDTLGTYMGCLDTIDYIVIDNSDGYDNVIHIIHSYDDYINYKNTLDGNYKICIKRRYK